MHIDDILIYKKISSSEKNYKHFIDFTNDDYKIKLLYTMLQKTSAYVKFYNGETKWMYFLLKMMNY